MYLDKLPENPLTTTLVRIKYDCCGKEHTLKWKDADKNFQKNGGKHICRSCGLKTNNPASKAEVREKMKQTSLRKYGTTCPLNTADKIAARVEKMFGTEESTERIVAKREATCQERYGASHIMKTEEGVRRQEEAMIEKYGVAHPLQNEEIKEKMRQTCQVRYGVDNPCQVPEVRVKMAQTTLEKYGVEHYNQLPEMKEYLQQNCKNWLAESYAAGGPNKGMPRPEEWNEKQSQTMANKIVAGDFNPEDPRFFVTGYFIGDKCKKHRPFFRSSLELRTHCMLEKDDDVIWYENEPFAIEYNNEGKIRRYIPDFIVVRRSLKSPQLLEIKPAFRLREVVVAFKNKVAEEYCRLNDMHFLFVDEKFLKQIVSLSLEELKRLPQVELSKSKR